jgi:hypothetical protein
MLEIVNGTENLRWYANSEQKAGTYPAKKISDEPI